MKRTDKKVRKDCKKNKTWELFYPDGTSSLMNYNPIAEERKWAIREVLKLIKAWDGYGDKRFPNGEIKELVREIRKLSRLSSLTGRIE